MFGVYSYVMVFSSLFTAISGLGLRKIVVRNLVKNRSQEQKIIGTTFYLMLIAGIICMTLCPLVVYLLRPDDKVSLTLVSILSIGFIFNPLRSVAYHYESHTKMKKVVLSYNLAFVIGVALKVIALVFELSIVWFVVATVVDVVLASLLLLLIMPSGFQGLANWKFDKAVAQALLKDSAPLILTAIAVNLYMKVDQIMIREMVNNTETGLYSAAVKISNIWIFVPTAIFVSVFPKIVKYRSDNQQKYKVGMQKLYSLSVFLSYSAMVCTVFLAKPLILFLLGQSYIKSASYLFILISSGLFIALGSARSLFMIAENMTKIYLYVALTGLFINIVLNCILIPKIGALGACYATLISYAVSAFITSFAFSSLRETGLMQLRAMIYPKFW